MESETQGISVVICCYNSEHRIQKVLEFLSRQKFLEGILWEIIIVDNNSVDNTKSVAENIWRKFGVMESLNVVVETEPGLSFARKTGVLNARFDYIVFCDDDNWLHENYLSEVFRIFKKDSSIGVVGGLNLPYSDMELPDWFGSFSEAFAIGAQSLETGDVTNERGYVWGAGMSIRGSLLKDLYRNGIKSQLVDRKSGSLSSGGDSEICKWFIMGGYRIFYSEELKLFHYIADPNRLQKKYLKELLEGFGDSEETLITYDYFIKIRKYSWVVKFIGFNIVSILYMLSDKKFYKLIKRLRALKTAMRPWKTGLTAQVYAIDNSIRSSRYYLKE